MSFIINPFVFAAGGGGGPAFPSLSDIWAWYEAARETGYSDSDGVSPATDQSGNGRNWTHATSSERPQWQANQINGLAVYNGDHAGNKGWQTGPDMSALTAGHVFAVIKAKADPAGDNGQTGLWNFGTDSLSAHVPFTESNVYDDCFSTARKSTGNPTTSLASAFVLYEIISTSSEWTRKINGATSGNDHFTTATNTVAGPAAPTLLFSSAAFTSRHKLAGLYIFSAKKTGTDRTDLINYINTRFATSYS